MTNYKGYEIETMTGCGGWDYTIFKDGCSVKSSSLNMMGFPFAFLAVLAAKKFIREQLNNRRSE